MKIESLRLPVNQNMSEDIWKEKNPSEWAAVPPHLGKESPARLSRYRCPTCLPQTWFGQGPCAKNSVLQAGTHEQSSCTENSLLEREKSLKIIKGTKRRGWQIVIVTSTCIHLHPLISQGSQATGDNECSTIWHCPSSIVPPTVSAT